MGYEGKVSPRYESINEFLRPCGREVYGTKQVLLYIHGES